jgi:hypothetical protein
MPHTSIRRPVQVIMDNTTTASRMFQHVHVSLFFSSRRHFRWFRCLQNECRFTMSINVIHRLLSNAFPFAYGTNLSIGVHVKSGKKTEESSCLFCFLMLGCKGCSSPCYMALPRILPSGTGPDGTWSAAGSCLIELVDKA